MSFDELLDKLWMFDFEVFSKDWLLVAINYRTKEEKIFHNASMENVFNFTNSDIILCGYNAKEYDAYILKGILSGFDIQELKKLNDYLIGGGQGWKYNFDYVTLPIIWDLFPEITPRKSLKELEGNLRLDITETTIPFDLPTKWTNEQYEEVLYYCRHDVQALFPIFKELLTKYKSKFIIAKFGKMDEAEALSMTDANLTAKLLNAEKRIHNDPYKYEYPSEIEKDKIPKQALDYFDDLIKHNDLNYKIDAPIVTYGNMELQLGEGGCHGFLANGVYNYTNGITFKCE